MDNGIMQLLQSLGIGGQSQQFAPQDTMFQNVGYSNDPSYGPATAPTQGNAGDMFLSVYDDPTSSQPGNDGLTDWMNSQPQTQSPLPVNQIAPALHEDITGIPQPQGSSTIMDILKGRNSDAQGPSFSDYANAITKTAYGKTPVTGQDEADAGIANQIKMLGTIGKGSTLGNVMARGGARGVLAEQYRTIHANDPKYANNPAKLYDDSINFTSPRMAGMGIQVNQNTGEAQNIPGIESAIGGQSGAKKLGMTAGTVPEQINKDADAALLGKRTIAEMQDLAQNFTPGKFAPVKANIKAYMQALGMDSSEADSVGSQQDFAKLTAGLAAQSVRTFSSRGTQMEFNTFLQNNPNAALTPQGLQGMMNYMDKSFDIPLQKQAEFQTWSQGRSPYEYENFSPYWNDKLNQNMRSTLTNPNAPVGGDNTNGMTKTIGGVTYINQGGKWYHQ